MWILEKRRSCWMVPKQVPHYGPECTEVMVLATLVRVRTSRPIRGKMGLLSAALAYRLLCEVSTDPIAFQSNPFASSIFHMYLHHNLIFISSCGPHRFPLESLFWKTVRIWRLMKTTCLSWDPLNEACCFWSDVVQSE